jgi:hypothetical protein
MTIASSGIMIEARIAYQSASDHRLRSLEKA